MSRRRHGGSDGIVVDASAMVDLLLGGSRGAAVQARLRGVALQAPGHLDAEVLSALGRLYCSGHITARSVSQRVRTLSAAPIQRHSLPPLLAGAWRRRTNLSLLDAIYVELAELLELSLLTTDRRLAKATSRAQYVGDDQ